MEKQHYQWLDLFVKAISAIALAIVGLWYTHQQTLTENTKKVLELATSDNSTRREAGLYLAEELNKKNLIYGDVVGMIAQLSELSSNPDTRSAFKTATLDISKSSKVAQRAVEQVITRLPARVYFHVSDGSQKSEILKLKSIIEAVNINGQRVIVPGIETKPFAGKRPELRCFTNEDCQQGQKIVDIASEHLDGLVLSNRIKWASGRDLKIRQLHFELWIPSGELTVSVRSLSGVTTNTK